MQLTAHARTAHVRLLREVLLDHRMRRPHRRLALLLDAGGRLRAVKAALPAEALAYIAACAVADDMRELQHEGVAVVLTPPRTPVACVAPLTVAEAPRAAAIIASNMLSKVGSKHEDSAINVKDLRF